MRLLASLLGWLRYWWGIVWQDVEDVGEGIRDCFTTKEEGKWRQ